MTSVESLPGTDTVIRLLPCCRTWAPVAPVPFTRDRRIDTAWFISSVDGGWPGDVCAWNTASVPLDRSSPSLTLNCWCHRPGRKVPAPVIETSIIAMIITSMASGRHGREALAPWGAIDRLPLGQARGYERCHRGR